MKIYLSYGGLMALAGALVTLLLFFSGFHTVEKFIWGAGIQLAIGFGIAITGLILGIKAKRAENGPGGLSYGQAFLTGTMISLVASVVGASFSTAYAYAINPGYQDVAIEWSATLLEKQGASEEKIEQMREAARKGHSLVKETVVSVAGGFIFGCVISLIAAAILRRPPDNTSDLSG